MRQQIKLFGNFSQSKDFTLPSPKDTHSLLRLSLVRFHFCLEFIHQILKPENIFSVFFCLQDCKNHRALLPKHVLPLLSISHI